MKKLAKQRRMVGLTQLALARMTGIAVQKITFAETGRTKLSGAEIEKIRGAFARRAAHIAASIAASEGAQEIPAVPMVVAVQSEKEREINERA